MFGRINLKEFISGSLRTRIILGVGIILLAVLGASSYFDVVTQVNRHIEENEKRAMEISDTVMKSIEYPMMDGEMEQVQAILERLGTLEDLEIVHLCDDMGIIKRNGTDHYDVNRKIVSKITLKAFSTGKLAQGIERCRRNNIDIKILRSAIPVYNEKACYKCHGDEKSLLGCYQSGLAGSRFRKHLSRYETRI